MSIRTLLRLVPLLLLHTPADAVEPVALRVNALENPTAVDGVPGLSWRMESSARAAAQSAYRILVASSPSALDRNEGDLWDSGKIISADSLHIPYAGPRLASNAIAYWKVRLWDQDDQPTEWSATGHWGVGLREKSDWQAEWIGLDDVRAANLPWNPGPDQIEAFSGAAWIRHGTSDEPGKSWFRASLRLPAGRAIRSATACFTADDEFTLTINGNKSLSGTSWKTVGVKSITGDLKGGGNQLSVEVNNGEAATGLLGAITVEFTDGGKLSLATGEEWQSSRDGKHFATAAILGSNGVAPWGELKPGADAKTYLPATRLRKDFVARGKPVRALLHVTALGHVEARLNGEKVDDSYFAPGWTDYAKRLYYRSFDVTSRIHAGPNTLGALLGDGWFRGNISILGQNRHGKHTRLRAQLHLRYADGSEKVVGSDDSWTASTGPILEADMFAGETYDARLETPGWDAPGFDAATWKPVVTGAELDPAVIQAYPMPPVRRTGELPAKGITTPAPGVQLFDFGQNFAGWVRLKINAPAGTVVRLRFGEMLQADGSLYTENLRSARATDTYICKGDGVETWEPRFTFHGFRYAEISGLPSPAAPDTLTGIVVGSDLPRTGAFECSDELINAIYRNTLWGQRSNYLEVPTDCPQRDERMGWSGDTQVFARTAAYNMDVDTFLAKWTTDMADAQSSAGAFPAMAPVYHDMWSPGWADAGVIVPWTLFQTYGDLGTAEKSYGAMVRHLEFCRTKAPDNLGPDEGFGDWLAVGGDTPKALIGTAYHAHSNELVSRLAASLGKSDDAAKYHARFEEIREAFQKAYVHADGKIGNDTQTGYLIALKFDLLTPVQREAAAKHLVAAIEARDGHLGTGFLGVNLLLPVLTDIGRSDLAYAMIRKDSYPSWGYSVRQGATTIWERWNSYTMESGFGDVSMNSFNHYAYGACVEWLYETVLGITPLEPGYRKVSIAPVPGGGLTHAAGHFDSVHGRIASAWKVSAGVFTLDVTVPPNTTAEIRLPATPDQVIKEGGKPVADSPGITPVGRDGNGMRVAAKAGSYHFTVSPR
ncbi:glycoside hydrolase family 78 protein [Luteolibacter marinus]|uniref:glycoside hydrolase family 78 protein n=1 Tax=Luteolibacter marinus TaxID=2776705 RepID=UPI00186940C4|nr:glycoside hydrolase family 78 protein [Luteolibacter marinus]